MAVLSEGVGGGGEGGCCCIWGKGGGGGAKGHFHCHTGDIGQGMSPAFTLHAGMLLLTMLSSCCLTLPYLLSSHSLLLAPAHRVIVGKSYYEQYNIAPEAPVEACLALLLARKMPRHSEGMLGTAEFPVNYFTVSEMEQWYDEEFAAQFL